MEILQKLFGSGAKVKIMRLFLFNPDVQFTMKAIREKTRLTPEEARREVGLLTQIGLAKKRSNRSRGPVWMLDETFPYFSHLKKLMTDTVMSSQDEISRKISRTCKLKALIFSGFFISNTDSRADILIVAQTVKKDALKSTIRKIESEIGKEIRYVVLDQNDFSYRNSIGDRLVRDIFDFPHIVAYDRLGVA